MRKYNTNKSNSWKKFGNIKLLTKNDFVKTCNESESMSEACSKLGIHFGTFKKYAEIYGCYKPNQSLKGYSKDIKPLKWDIDNWNNNEPIYVTRAVLRKWLFRLILLPLKCNKCGLNKWLEQPISLEINHINGINNDNRKDNIELLCPNCHAQTDNYRGKNK